VCDPRLHPVFTAAPPPLQVPIPALGCLTVSGVKLETILGGYYRLWLMRAGVLTGHDADDSVFVYFHANNLERTIFG
jgi:hypothetical protein